MPSWIDIKPRMKKSESKYSYTVKTSHLSKLTETLYLASCSVEVKAEDWVLRPGTISPDKWNPASRIGHQTDIDLFKEK